MLSEELRNQVADLAMRRGLSIAVAESLTSGAIASALGASPRASEWFAGGVVSYSSAVKFEVLGVTKGPVITARCAREMAEGVAQLLDVTVTASVTGVGGPGPEEGRAAGTVFIGIHFDGRTDVVEERFAGGPSEIIEATVNRAVHLLIERLASHA